MCQLAPSVSENPRRKSLQLPAPGVPRFVIALASTNSGWRLALRRAGMRCVPADPSGGVQRALERERMKYERLGADTLRIFKLNREAIYVSCGFAQRSPILGYHVEYCL